MIPIIQVRGTAAETALLVVPASGISIDELERAAIGFALERMRRSAVWGEALGRSAALRQRTDCCVVHRITALIDERIGIQ